MSAVGVEIDSPQLGGKGRLEKTSFDLFKVCRLRNLQKKKNHGRNNKIDKFKSIINTVKYKYGSRHYITPM